MLLTQTGPRETAPRIGRHLAKFPVHPFDLRHSAHASGLMAGSDQAQRRQITAYCLACSNDKPRTVLDSCADYVFVDRGCGKGRVAMLASHLPFCQAIGVELAQILLRSHNPTCSSGKWTPIARDDIVVPNAEAFEIPLPESPTLLDLFPRCKSFPPAHPRTGTVQPPCYSAHEPGACESLQRRRLADPVTAYPGNRDPVAARKPGVGAASSCPPSSPNWLL